MHIFIAHFPCLLMAGWESKQDREFMAQVARVILMACTEIAPLGVVVLNISMYWCTKGLPGENRMGLLQLAKPGV